MLSDAEKSRLWAAYVGTVDDTSPYVYDLEEYKSSFDLQESVSVTTRSTRGLKKGKAKSTISTTACKMSKKTKSGKHTKSGKGASRDQVESEPGDMVIVNYAASVPINTVLDSLFIEQKHAWVGDCLVPVDEDDAVIEDAVMEAAVINGFTSPYFV